MAMTGKNMIYSKHAINSGIEISSGKYEQIWYHGIIEFNLYLAITLILIRIYFGR